MQAVEPILSQEIILLEHCALPKTVKLDLILPAGNEGK